MICPGQKYSRVKSNRELDIYYEPIFLLPSSKDYQREFRKSKDATISIVVKPIFESMFSDSRPRNIQIAKRTFSTPDDIIFTDTAPIGNVKELVKGSRRPIYFKTPITSLKPKETTDLFPKIPFVNPPLPDTTRENLQKQHKMTQSDYRESETQTGPWTHDVIATHKMKLLQLGWLGANSLVGYREIAQIKRQWHKQAWDELMPRMSLLSMKELRKAITEGLAFNDTAAREQVLEEDIMLRLSLSAANMEEKLKVIQSNLDNRLQRFSRQQVESRIDTLAYLKKKLNRELKKLNDKKSC